MNTFDDIRIGYLKENPPPAFLEDVFLSKKLTKAELIALLENQNVEINARTLNYYISEGLVDKPIISRKRSGKGKESYFSEMDSFKIVTIKIFQERGFSLDDIKKKVVILPELIDLSHSERDDVKFNYFKSLATKLVENLPEEIKEETIATYFSLIQSNDETEYMGEMVKSTVKTIRLVLKIRESVLEKLKKRKVKNLERIYNNIYDQIWQSKLEGLFKQLSGAHGPESLPLLTYGSDRTEVLFAYHQSVLMTCQALAKSYIDPDFKFSNFK